MDVFMNSVIRKTAEDGEDFYATQPWPTRALLERVHVSGLVWEPACGGGHMSEVLTDHGLEVVSSDKTDWGYGLVHDFLADDPVANPDWIVTNPPFKRDKVYGNLAEAFTLRALSITPNVAILNRLSWLEGGERFRRVFEDHPPSWVFVLIDRVGFEEGTCPVGRRGMIPYAWYVWQEGVADTRVRWVPPGTDRELTCSTDAERFGKPLCDRDWRP